MGVVRSFWGHFGVILVKLGAVGFLRELFWGYFSAFRAILVSLCYFNTFGLFQSFWGYFNNLRGSFGHFGGYLVTFGAIPTLFQ